MDLDSFSGGRSLPHAVEVAIALGVPPGDVLDSSSVPGLAEKAKRKYGIEADWEVSDGHPADAICEYLDGQHDVMLAMSSHARGGLKETIFGSVTHECARRAGVPVLVYRPEN